jgi:hypothetical protein
MIYGILWSDATSDTCPIAWCNFNSNDLDGAAQWLASQKQFYSRGFARITRGRHVLMQDQW